mgnify:CR=1 FL=1
MQTPLQMLIEILDREALDNTGFYTPGEFEVIASVKKHATELLEKERQIIIEAYRRGGHDGIDISHLNSPTYENGSDYFTKTFTEKKD